MLRLTIVRREKEERDALAKLPKEVEQRLPDLLRQVGNQVLERARTAYDEKSQGKAGSDGITWKPLSRPTLRTRVAGSPAGRQLLRQQQELTAANRLLTRSKASVRTARSAAERAALRIRNRSLQQQITVNRAARRLLKQQFEALVAAAGREALIGVETGLQRSSGKPGFRAADGEGGNTFIVEKDQVTVGYGRSYSPHFDAARPLLPETLPPSWKQSLEALVNTWTETLLKPASPRP